MKCIVCHGEDVQVTEAKEEIKVDNDIVYVSIQTPVCRACGERYYDRRTVRFLEESVFWRRWSRSSRRKDPGCKRWAKCFCMAETEDVSYRRIGIGSQS
jgi:YgiT-type zinc finger domain-containing protein